MAPRSDSPAAPPRRHAWSRAGLVWACVNLAALAVGMFPGMVTVPESGAAAAPLPTLKVVAAVDVAFLLLIYPLVLARRDLRAAAGRMPADTAPPSPGAGPAKARPVASGVGAEHAGAGSSGLSPADAARTPPGRWPARVCEAALWLVVAGPFLGVAAWLADATLADAVRVVLMTAAIFPAAWALADLACGGSAGVSVATLAALLIVPGGLAANYLVWEFLPTADAAWLWLATPATFAWTNATARLGAWTPTPLWAWLLWPAAAAGAFFIRMTRR